MKKQIIFLAFIATVIIVSINLVTALQDPAKAYCEAMRYEYVVQKTVVGNVGFCKFNKYDSCIALDFLKGKCGEEYSYCIKKGYILATINDKKICSIIPFSSECSVCITKNRKKTEVTKLMGLNLNNNSGKVYTLTNQNTIILIIILILVLIVCFIIFLVLKKERVNRNYHGKRRGSGSSRNR